jgi:hypothetical protein
MRQQVIDKAIEEPSKREVGPVLREEPGGHLAEFLDLVSPRGFDQRFARWKVAVERAAMFAAAIAPTKRARPSASYATMSPWTTS